jgi:hypothetical protein
MADVGIYCKNAGIQAKAGLGASAVSKLTAWTDLIVLGVENYINVVCKKKYTAAVYAALSADVKYLLVDTAENLCAIYVILYDFEGYPSRTDAEDKINVLYQIAKSNLKLLQDPDIVNFMT